MTLLGTDISVSFLSSSKFWGVRVKGHLVSKHDSRDAAMRAGAKRAKEMGQ